MHVFSDLKSIYDSLTRINQMTEKQLLIDLRKLRQSYERRKITEVFWITTKQNPADAFTKATPTPALKSLIEQNLPVLKPNSCVEPKFPD